MEQLPRRGRAPVRAVTLLVAVLSAAWAAAPAAWAGRTVDVSLSNDTARIELERSLQGGRLGRTLATGSVFFSDNDDQLLALGLHVRGEAGSRSPGLFAGLGLDGHLGSLRGKTVGALSVGGGLDYYPPALPRLHLGLAARYAPRILAFVKADGLTEVRLRLGYEVLRDAFVYAEYRRVEVGLEGLPSRVPDDGGHLGLRFTF